MVRESDSSKPQGKLGKGPRTIPASITIGKTTFRLPYAYLMRPLTPEEYGRLEADIKAHGVLVPVFMDEHCNVLDGVHRLMIAEVLRRKDIPSIILPGLSDCPPYSMTSCWSYAVPLPVVPLSSRIRGSTTRVPEATSGHLSSRISYLAPNAATASHPAKTAMTVPSISFLLCLAAEAVNAMSLPLTSTEKCGPCDCTITSGMLMPGITP